MHSLKPAPLRSGATTMTALITTWVFALLPANLVPSIIEKLVHQLDVDITVAGFVATGMTLANAAAVLGSRRIVQRGHRVLVARVGLTIMILAFVTGAALPSAEVSMIALVMGGLGSGLVISSATAAVSAAANPDRATAVGMIVNRLVVSLAFLTIPLVGGGVRELFLILAVPGLLAFVGAQWLPRVPEETETPRMADRSDTANDSARASDGAHPDRGRADRARRVGWLLAIGFGAWSITDDGVYGLVGVIVGESSMSVGDGFVANIFALSIFCGLGGALVAPLLHRWLGRTVALGALLTISAAAKLGLMLITDPALYTITSAVWGFVFGAMLPLVFGLAASLSRDGGVSVLVNGVYIVGVALGPLVATQLFDRFGTPALAATMSTIAVVTACLMVYASRFSETAHAHPEAGTQLPEAAAAPQKIGQ